MGLDHGAPRFGERQNRLAGVLHSALADESGRAGLRAERRHHPGEESGLGDRGVDGGLGFKEGGRDLFGSHPALLEHEFSPARAGIRRSLRWFTRLWLLSGLGPEKSLPEILERVEPRQHHPKGQGGNDRNSDDRPEASEGA